MHNGAAFTTVLIFRPCPWWVQRVCLIRPGRMHAQAVQRGRCRRRGCQVDRCATGACYGEGTCRRRCTGAPETSHVCLRKPPKASKRQAMWTWPCARRLAHPASSRCKSLAGIRPMLYFWPTNAVTGMAFRRPACHQSCPLGPPTRDGMLHRAHRRKGKAQRTHGDCSVDCSKLDLKEALAAGACRGAT